jgi:hypothetical protein
VSIPLPPGERNVLVIWLDNGNTRGEFTKSLLDMGVWDANYDHKIYGATRIQSSANITSARNMAVAQFLDSSAEKLMLIDSDMVFRPDMVSKLSESCSGEVPIVGGLTWRVSKVDNKVSTTMYLMDENQQLIQPESWPDDALVQVWATGAACLMIHRTAAEKIKKAAFSDAFPWFQESSWKGEPMSEDVTFCIRAQMALMPIYVDTGVEVGHMKERMLTINDWKVQKQVSDLTGMVESFTRDGQPVDSLESTSDSSTLPDQKSDDSESVDVPPQYG